MRCARWWRRTRRRAGDVRPEGDDEEWWRRANALWLASKEYLRRHGGCDAASRSSRATGRSGSARCTRSTSWRPPRFWRCGTPPTLTKRQRPIAREACRESAANPRGGAARIRATRGWISCARSRIHGRGVYARKAIPRGHDSSSTPVSASATRRRTGATTTRRCGATTPSSSSSTAGRASTPRSAATSRATSTTRAIRTASPGSRGSTSGSTRCAISRAGEELAYDYEYDFLPGYTVKDLDFYGCECGSPKCRGNDRGRAARQAAHRSGAQAIPAARRARDDRSARRGGRGAVVACAC